MYLIIQMLEMLRANIKFHSHYLSLRTAVRVLGGETMQILLIEDDVNLAEALAEALTDQKYAVTIVLDGEAGWEQINQMNYDLILLDIMLPKLDGIKLCRLVRSRGFQVPLLMLTARDTSTDKITGLDSGADDYVVKPFDLEELLARVRCLLRRGRFIHHQWLEWGSLYLNPLTHEVKYSGVPLHLTPKEFAILKFLIENGRQVINRAMILQSIWGIRETPEEETVKAHVKALRHKLKLVGAPVDLIETVHGVGYRLKHVE